MFAAHEPFESSIGIAQRRHEQAVIGIHGDADIHVRVQGAGQVLAIEPRIERRHRLACGDDSADEAGGNVLLADPGMQVGIVDGVVGTTLACASAMTRAMCGARPPGCSGWP